MRKSLWIAVAGLTALGTWGCHTITEELPTRPTAAPNLTTVPLPVVVTPVQLPIPSNPGPTPAPNPGPNPDPNPAPPDSPSEPPNNNHSTVARLGAKVYFVECGGVPVPGSEFATTAQVGCRIHLDVTAKDSGNKPTNPKGTPEWTYSDHSIINVSGKSGFNPVLLAKGRGDLSMFAEVDGVRSNTVSIRIN